MNPLLQFAAVWSVMAVVYGAAAWRERPPARTRRQIRHEIRVAHLAKLTAIFREQEAFLASFERRADQ